MKKRIKIVLLFVGILCMPQLHFAQVDFNKVPNDDLGNMEDEFQEHFFEALKQKGIENYDRAVTSLLQCINLESTHPIVFFELGKNYVMLKNFGAAEDAFKKAIALDEENEWYRDGLYGVYLDTKEYDKAIRTLKSLIKYHPDYKKDLANVYYQNKNYKEALNVLDELDAEEGQSKLRDRLRNTIYNITGADKDRIQNIKHKITNDPQNEDNYLSLIYRYSELGDKKKAFETAKELLKIKPESHLVHLALYKYYLDANEESKAIESMKVVVKSKTVKPEAKAKVLNDFVNFVKDNPQYEGDLLEVTTMVSDDNTGKSDVELAKYYLQKNNKEKALAHYKIALEKEPDSFSMIKSVLLLYIDLNQFEKASELSSQALETYPAQPILYLANGVANNNLNRPKDAIESLEMGVDYVIDNVIMEVDFYKQLSIAYRMTNNITKSNAFANKAQKLLNKE